MICICSRLPKIPAAECDQDNTFKQAESAASLLTHIMMMPHLLMPGIFMDVSGRAPQVPELHDGVVVILVCAHNLGGHGRMPSQRGAPPWIPAQKAVVFTVVLPRGLLVLSHNTVLCPKSWTH